MITAASAIAALDLSIAKAGQIVKLKRGQQAARSIPAGVRGFQPNEIAGLLQQGDRQVILSPSSINGDEPQEQDKISIAGGAATIQSIERIHIGDTLVRLNLVVRG